MNSTRLELEVEVMAGSGPAYYRYSLAWEKPPPMDQIEAHAKTIMRILDEQAHEGLDEDDDEAGV